jgi:hypothetical protein
MASFVEDVLGSQQKQCVKWGAQCKRTWFGKPRHATVSTVHHARLKSGDAGIADHFPAACAWNRHRPGE